MPRAKDNSIRIDVSEAMTNDTRTITVTINAPAKGFQLPDLFVERGAYDPIETGLKPVIRDAVQNYIEGAEGLVATIAASQRKGANGAKAKGREVVEGSLTGAVNGSTNGLHDAAGSQSETMTQNVAQ